ncbi:MAG: hypothetical protein C0402_06100 [Thermodesulfovibrio sp.]|nr:hypothetical protein [Thermodesulfovibrio sp.]
MADKATIMKEAQKYVLKGQIDKAIAEWDKLIREAPDGNTFNIIGDLYLRKGDKKGAAEYLHKSANFFRHEGFSLKALALYKKVLNINPTDTDALNALGQLSEEKGLVTDSIKYYLATAECLSKEGRKDELLEIYQKILALSPSNVLLRIKVAEIFLKEGLVSDAAGQYIAIAQTYAEKDDSQKALEFYQKALEIQPSSKPAVLGICFLLEKAGDLADAIAQMKAAASLFPEDVNIVLKYAELSLAAGQGADSEGPLLHLRTVDPGNITVRKFLGEIYLKAGQPEKAWEEYMPVIDDMVAEEKYDTAIHLLELFREVAPVEAARRLVSLFTQTRDDDRLAAELVGLGELYQEKGLTEEAINCFREAAEVKPYDEEIQRLLRASEPVKEPVTEAVTETVTEPARETPQGKDTIAIVTGAEKSADEIFVETDIFSRYGLVHEAVKLLESLKLREPQNIDVHIRLKALYAETAEKELAVTECLILHELYKRKGEPENADKELRDAVEIAPTDPRLAGRVEPPPVFEPTSYSSTVPEPDISQPAEEIEDYEDALAEADFYIRQGLMQEASKILEKMHNLFPENVDITERLESIGQIAEPFDSGTITAGHDSYESQTDFATEQPKAEETDLPEFELEPTGFASDFDEPAPQPPAADYSDVYRPEAPDTAAIPSIEDSGPESGPGPALETDFENTEPDTAAAETELPPTVETAASDADVQQDFSAFHEEQAAVAMETALEEPGISIPPLVKAPEKKPSEPPAKDEYEDLMLTEQDLDEAQVMPDLALDNDVLEIFQEFKKGLEKELGDEDSETHYNLGIAYKEMGLIDDAIKEFQSSRNDPKRYIQSSTMLGVCYMEKSLYTLAIDVLKKITLEVTEKDESYWPVRFELAEAYEKNNNLREALDLYTAVYGWNAKFRGVSEKVSQVSAQLGSAKNENPRGGTDAGSSAEKPKLKKDRVSYL